MKITINSKPIASFVDWAWKMGGGYFVRLIEIEIAQKGDKVNFVPVYHPIFAVSSHGGQTVINWFFSRKICFSFMFFRYFPFINVCFRKVEYDEETEVDAE